MSFAFMVFHWPDEAERDALAESTRELRDALLGLPGCLPVEPPYATEDGSCLVGISKWTSKEAVLSSGLTLRPADEVAEGETRPRRHFLLQEA